MAIVLSCVAATLPAGAVVIERSATGSGEWNDESTWDPGSIPLNDTANTYNVTIDGGRGVNLHSGTVFIDKLSIFDNSNMTVDADATLNVVDGGVVLGNTASPQLNVAGTLDIRGGSLQLASKLVLRSGGAVIVPGGIIGATNGGSVEGHGTISGPVTLGSNANSINPSTTDASPPTLNIQGDLTMTGATWGVDINSATDYSRIVVTGANSIATLSGSNSVLWAVSLNYSLNPNLLNQYEVLTAPTIVATGPGNIFADGASFIIEDTNYGDVSASVSITGTAGSGQSLFLTLSPVPEPTSLGSIGVLAAFMLGRRRRRAHANVAGGFSRLPIWHVGF